MTQQQFKQNIRRELRMLNEQIDYKILRGERYSQESRRHKALTRYMSRQTKRGLFSKLFSFA